MNKVKNTIVEVFEDNFIYEIKRMSSYLEKYNFVAMDTEFPGIVYQLKDWVKDFYYKTIKMNVDNLKVIQVGITLCDEKGRYPPGNCTWQYNLKFDWTKDKYSNESIALLNSSGIDFSILYEKGVSFDIFAEYLMTSGLVLNDDIHWISFHGSYDFAYLLKSLTANSPLPDTENYFLDNLELYFRNFYDIRHLLRNQDNFKGSLSKIAQDLEVVRVGTTHQAGSDSIVTAEVFFRLFKRSHLTSEHLKLARNILYGIGEGADDYETLSYSNFTNMNTTNINLGMNSMGNLNGINNLNTLPNQNTYASNYGYHYLQNNVQYKTSSNPNVLYMNPNNIKGPVYNNFQQQPVQGIYNYNPSNGVNVINSGINNMSNINNMNSMNSMNINSYNSMNNTNNINTGNINVGIMNNKDKKKNFAKMLEAKSN